MKRVIFFFAVLIAANAAQAQVNPHAIGLRLGGGYYNGVEISYQQGLGGVNRLELDLGLGGNRNYNFFQFSGTYHWVKPTNWTDGMNWYIGPGAYIGNRGYRGPFRDLNDDYFALGANGQIGLEYNFDFPLNLSIDLRPQLEIIGDPGLYTDLALGVRYIF